MMTRDDLQARLTAQADADPTVLALLLSGSLGRGDGDRWSDLDLVVVVSPENHSAFVGQVRAWLERAAPLVHWFLPHPPLPLFSGVTEDWLRCDLTVTVPGGVLAVRDNCRALVDRAGVWDALPSTLPSRSPDPARASALVHEFIRVLGLLPVGLGRGELVVAVTGTGLQRTALINLMVEALGLPQPPGALHLSRLLAPEDIVLLERLPAAEATRASVIAANHAIAAAFVTRARRLMEQVGEPWPETFWAATRAHLQGELGVEWQDL